MSDDRARAEDAENEVEDLQFELGAARSRNRSLESQLAEANRKLELWEWSVENCYVYRDHEDLYFASSFDWERATACFNSPVEAIAALRSKVEKGGE